MSEGQELLAIAKDCYRRKKSERTGVETYGGLEYSIAVGQAMRQDVKEHGKTGKRKARRDEAERTVSTMFTNARKKSTEVLDRIASQASAVTGIGDKINMAAVGDDLRQFAEEVVADLQASVKKAGLEKIFGLIDPTFIINLIMQIIAAIKACKNPVPVPTPTPAPA